MAQSPSRFFIEVPGPLSKATLEAALTHAHAAPGFKIDIVSPDTKVQFITRGESQALHSVNGYGEIHHGPFDNPKVQVVQTIKDGRALMAFDDIKKGESIATFDGQVYETTKSSCRGLATGMYVIQIGLRSWRDSDGVARYANHSCEPNCGINGLDRIVAIRDIRRLEEITWAYWMTEDPGENDLDIACTCNRSQCLGRITGFSNIPQEFQQRYAPWLSDWIRAKHNITVPRP